MRTNDDLKAEYLLIQGQYEAFDQRALSLKALATPLLGAGLAFGFDKNSPYILLATVIVATSLWLLEGMWKGFQYCYADRIKLLEAWYRGEGEESVAPFQIFSSWSQVWDRDYRYRYAAGLKPILKQPFVFMPYLPIVVIGLIGCALTIVASF